MPVESSQEFIEIKQVSARTIQVCQGINEDQCLEHFYSKGRTSLQCWKVRKISGYGGAHLPCRENCMLLIAAANQSAGFSFSMANYS